jgi:malonyl CoA-acyl carrier protein transacylase
VHEALKSSSLNFVGNVEGGDIFTGRVDVIVMDGFTGNVVLKASETLADTLMRLIKEEIQRKNVRKVGAFLSKGAFNAVRHRIDPSEYGGAPLLGVKGCCVIGHGRSNAVAIKHGIRTARRLLHERRERADRGRAARPGAAARNRPRRPRAHDGRASSSPARDRRRSAWGGPSTTPSREPGRLRRGGRALGFPLSRLCFEGPEDQLQLTANTQPAILTVSVAAARALAARGVKPEWVAGHSLGEYSALVTAGVLSLREAVVAVRRRGEYMQEAVPVGVGAMAAILALDLGAIEQACREAAQGQVVSPANINSPGQVVIAGHAEAVDRASELCKKAGAKRAIRLPVSAPFHCALMMPAQERLARDLAGLSFNAPAVPLVNNVDAAEVRTADAGP